MELKKHGSNFGNDFEDVIKLVINASAYILKEVYTHTSGGREKESKVFVPPASTIRRVLISKDGDSSSYFDKTNEINNNGTF